MSTIIGPGWQWRIIDPPPGAAHADEVHRLIATLCELAVRDYLALEPYCE